jgi:hypothetical protein
VSIVGCTTAQTSSHEVDHIISEKHGGLTTEDNLCLSCYDCNRFKGSDIGSYDALTDTYTRLFHPRKDSWGEHFVLEDTLISPLTAIGRVTVLLLRLNVAEQLIKRAELIKISAYPCKEL